jgi:hypothetical protein
MSGGEVLVHVKAQDLEPPPSLGCDYGDRSLQVRAMGRSFQIMGQEQQFGVVLFQKTALDPNTFASMVGLIWLFR